MKKKKKYVLFTGWDGPTVAIISVFIGFLSAALAIYWHFSHTKQCTPSAQVVHKDNCPKSPTDPCEYQFFIEDTMVIVWNNERYVGGIPLDGSLKGLIIVDNE